MQAKLRCQVSIGQFSSECVVIVKSFNDKTYSLFVPKTDVEYAEAPIDDLSVEGWLKVKLIRGERNLYLVRLPQTTLENGQFLTVRGDQLDRAPTTSKQLV